MGTETRKGIARVLVVDDEPSICRALALALRRAGYEALTAQSGDGALAQLKAGHVDVLLLDFRIPDLRGDALFELAASMQPHLRRRTLFMTGDITERAQQLIEACGCPLVRKPFDLTDVIGAIAALLPRRERISA
jgi:DNA-binding NtrC family response regulator